MVPGPAATPGEEDLCQAIWRRHTDRGPFSGQHIPRVLRAGMQKSTALRRTGRRMLDRLDTATVLSLAAQAGRELAADEAHHELRKAWLRTGC
jgi:hypothetical protein